jgi:hypothetical protein
MTQEEIRLQEVRAGTSNRRRWGPYLSERQWGTVREDYSQDGNAWDYFTHDQARSRAYHWGEDSVAGISDDKELLCFSVGLWNGHDPILKERLFGLTNSESNHGEDVKEDYFYLDSTPTHSVNPESVGTNAPAHYQITVGAGETATIRLRLSDLTPAIGDSFKSFAQVMQARQREADEFYRGITPERVRAAMRPK